MKKMTSLCLMIILLSYCGAKPDQVETIIEDGVEVVINHLEPYEIKGESSKLRLLPEFSIDLEQDEIAEIGLTSIRSFDIDDEGNIYFVDTSNPAFHIFKFDNNGSFVSSFGRKGQGPGETQWPEPAYVMKENIIVGAMNKVLFFSKDGQFQKEIPRKYGGRDIIPLENGNYLAHRIIRGKIQLDFLQHTVLNLLDSEFKQIKEITKVTIPHPSKSKGYRAVHHYFIESVRREHFYVGKSDSGNYDIHQYDLEGRLVKKIRKVYQPVAISAQEKKDRISAIRLAPQYMKTVYCPDYFPPFQRMLFPDDQGRLFVMTYEKGGKPREYIYDIFNPDGAFIGRMLLDNGGSKDRLYWPLLVISKHGSLYWLHEKDSGYLEFVVSKMIWE